jgi:two-component system, NtrC family, response regulator AtoC
VITKLLIVDDDKLTRETLASAFAGQYRISTARNGLEALAELDNESIDLVLSDLSMPDMDGITMLERINQRESRPAVIFITGHATVESAVAAMKLGAHDYVTKPVNLDRLGLLLEKALEARKLREENLRLKRSIRQYRAPINLIGKSPGMERIVERAAQVASTDAGVLIEGESGTGKELIASLIHFNSRRADAPMIKVNCAAFAEGLLESELFGHERGAFTGAISTKKGRFELADGGTLFLDEIGDLPAAAQVKLLRFLQDRSFERVGGTKTYQVDVRIVAATHRNLKEQVASGAFREDLLYRLRVVSLTLPPLRERTGDIEILARHFLEHYCDIHNRPCRKIADDVLELMRVHTWPGNVRELMHCVESMAVMSQSEVITLDEVPDFVSFADAVEASETGALADMERRMIVDMLRETAGNKVEAARKLGIGLRTLYRKIEKWAL